MAKQGRPSTLLEGLDEPTRERLLEAIRSKERAPYAELYRRFGLEKHGIKENSFEKFARAERKSAYLKMRESSPPSASSSGSSSGLAHGTIHRVLDRVQVYLDAGDERSLPHAAAILRACTDIVRMDFDQAANARAGEIHETKMAELRKKQDAALAELAAQEGAATGLTPELLAAIKSKVLGI